VESFVEGWFGAEDFFDGGMYREYIWEAIDLAVVVSLLSGGLLWGRLMEGEENLRWPTNPVTPKISSASPDSKFQTSHYHQSDHDSITAMTLPC
jgi:hypothetical protein